MNPFRPLRFLDDLPIRRKLVVVIMVVCAASLAVACGALFWFQSAIFRENYVAELKSLASVVARNSAAPLIFQDPRAAHDILRTLNVNKQISDARLFDTHGNIVARFDDKPGNRPVASLKDGINYAGGDIVLYLPVEFERTRLGTLYVYSRFDQEYSRLRSLYIALLVAVMAACLIVILAFSATLQGVITRPIMALAKVAREITEKKDYAVRATYESRDEIGLLTSTFNEMLDQIQTRDAQLRQVNISLQWEIQDRQEREERERGLAERALQRHAILLKLSHHESANYFEQLDIILAEAARFLRVERVGFWRLTEDASGMICEREFLLSPGHCHSEPNQCHATEYPKYFELLLRSTDAIVSSDTLADPWLAELVEDYFKPLGVTSTIDAPVVREGRMPGVVCFDHVGPKRIWTVEETDFARSIAQQVAFLLESRERRQAEEASRRSEQRYRSVVNSVKEVIFQTDDCGAWIFLNPAWTDITGFSVEYSLGRDYLEFVCPEDRVKCAALIQPLLDQKEWEAQGDFRFKTAGGSVCWVEVMAQRTQSKDDSATGISGTLADITARKQAETELADLNRRVAETQRQAGMAEVATGVLHNVGNVLNSVNVSAALLRDSVARSKLQNLVKATSLLRDHAADTQAFLTADPKGRMLPDYLIKLGDHLAAEQRSWQEELIGLGKNIEHIKEIVSMQQNYARLAGVIEALEAKELVEDAIRINESALGRHGVTLVRDYHAVPRVGVDKHKVLQILINLIRNAKYAMDECRVSEKILRLSIHRAENGSVRIRVEDNGVGIPAENLARIFSHGFTTRKDGHGFGLHSGANAAKEMGGKLYAHSDGSGQGARFTLELPVAVEPVLAATAPAAPTAPATPDFTHEI
jgi:PAS domain S-box-containing protein